MLFHFLDQYQKFWKFVISKGCAKIWPQEHILEQLVATCTTAILSQRFNQQFLEVGRFSLDTSFAIIVKFSKLIQTCFKTIQPFSIIF